MPLIKLAYLLVRTVAKPVASTLKSQTKSHPKFRASCVRLAQLQHRLEIRLSRILSNSSGTGRLIRPLDEERAVEVGANLLGEVLVFGVAGAIVIIEGRAQMEREAARRQAIEDKFTQIFDELKELRNELHSRPEIKS